MPLLHDDSWPLPTRRALREAERARAAGAPTAGGAPDEGSVGPRSVRPCDRAAAAGRTAGPAAPVVPPPAVRAGRDDEEDAGDAEPDHWAAAVLPRPTPVAARVPAGTPGAVVPAARDRRTAWRRLPQALVVGSLVAATLGYATTGDTAATAGEVLAFERTEETVRAESPTVVAAAENTSVLVAGEDGLLRVEDGASRSADRTPLPGCDGVPPETAQENGRMDTGYLCTLWDGQTEVRADAAVSLALLNEQYRARFGEDLCLTDGYRSYAAQVSVRARKPGLAARPGTSEHGFGLAVDLCGGVESQGEGYWWLRENAGALGYENPAWAQRGGGGPFEPWHWEYVAGQW